MPSKPPEVDGVSFTPDAIEDVRQEIIVLRNTALGDKDPYLAVILTHAIVMLARLKHYEENFQHAE